MAMDVVLNAILNRAICAMSNDRKAVNDYPNVSKRRAHLVSILVSVDANPQSFVNFPSLLGTRE